MAYKLTPEVSKRLEDDLRKNGSALISKEWICWSQFYYQQLAPADSLGPLDNEHPIFTMVGVRGKEYMISETREQILLDGGLHVPSVAINITELDSKLFEKVNVFNLIRKTVKRIKYVFKHFNHNQVDIFLNENMVIFDGGDPKWITSVMSGMKSLNLNAGFVRPDWDLLDTETRTAIWIYQLAKQTERVFSPENIPTDVKFEECLFAKEFLLA